MVRVVSFEEIPDLVGKRFTGASITVTPERRDEFEVLTHVREAYPEPDAPEFPAGIVEGFHTLSLLDAMATLERPFDPATTYGFNYGLDRVRFISPVMVGDRIESEFEVIAVEPKGDGWLIARRATLTVQGAPRPALVADWWLYILPRADLDSAQLSKPSPEVIE